MRLKMLAFKRLTFSYCRYNDGYKRWSTLMENDDVTVHLSELRHINPQCHGKC